MIPSKRTMRQNNEHEPHMDLSAQHSYGWNANMRTVALVDIRIDLKQVAWPDWSVELW